MSLTCGVDVGGTKIAAGVVTPAGEVLEQLRVTSPATEVANIETAIVSAVSELRERHEITAVGVGAAGYISRDRSRVMFAPNLAWRDLDLRADLEERLALPVVVENDANAAAWGEFCHGAGADADHLLLVTIGTGVGGGIVIDGRLFRGAYGVAAEVGHVQLDPNGPMCGCGNRGCLEVYASGTALVRQTREAVDAGALTARDLLDRAGGKPKRIDGPMISQAAAEGDRFAIEQLAQVGRRLGEGLASLVAVLDPELIVIGGGVSAAGELLIGPAREAFEARLTGRGHRPGPELQQASLGNTAGLIGAADLARLRD